MAHHINEFDAETQAAIRRRLAETGGGTMLPERRPVAAETRLRGRVDGMYRSKLERDFAGVLEGWRMAGYIVDWHYERLTLKLADGVRLTPDFLVGKGMCGRPVVYEVKGPYFRDDARIKLRVAAEQFSWLKWVLVQRQQGGWVYTTLGKEARQ